MARADDLPAPKTMCFRSESRSGLGYVVVDPDDNVVPGTQTSSREIADLQAKGLQSARDARLKRGPRNCLCCGRMFVSEGIHNRMCDSCRKREDFLGSSQRPTVTRTRRM